MLCPSCGTAVTGGAQSCPNCGRQFLSAPTPERGKQPALEQTTPPQPDVALVTPTPPVYAPPSQPFYGYPSQPLYGPPSQPYYGAPQSMPFAGAPPTVPLPRREPFDKRRFFIGGIPLWAGIVALILVVVRFGIGVFALKKDWADSAWIAAFVALAGAGIILVAGIVLLALRRFQWLTLGPSALLLVALSASGIFALTGQSTIHRLQARALENGKQWQASIHEYGLAGEQPPDAPTIARVELEWGEQYYGIQRYREATNLYLQALSDDSSDAAIETRAKKDLYQAHVAWLYANPPDEAYAEMAGFLEKYLQLAICDADCRSFTRPLAALALYKRGVVLLKKGIYCDDAIATYQGLVTRYADTQGGQLAAAALVAPVTFAVLIYYLPKEYTNAVAHLSRHVSPEAIGKVQYTSNDFAARIDADEDAVFLNVLPGKYNFSFDYPPGSQHDFAYWWGLNPVDLYSAHVKPLCGGVQSFSY